VRRLFASISLVVGSLSILASVEILRVWMLRGRASALFAANIFFPACALLVPLILVWLVVLWRRQGRTWPALDRVGFGATVAALIFLLVLTGYLVVADSFVRFEIFDEGKVPIREIVISGRGLTGSISEVAPGSRQSVWMALRGMLAETAGEIRIQYRIGDQSRTRIVDSAHKSLTDDVVEIHIDESGARRSPGGWLFPPPGQP